MTRHLGGNTVLYGMMPLLLNDLVCPLESCLKLWIMRGRIPYHNFKIGFDLWLFLNVFVKA